MDEHIYDLVIIGGSAAGTAAGIYAARRRLNVTMISQDFGGEVARGGDYLNYPGIVQTTGLELTAKFKEHLAANDLTPELGVWVNTITKIDQQFEIDTVVNGQPKLYHARTVIVATGVHPRHLEVPGEERLQGRGVTYCTTCDGPLFKNKKVVTIGGGNSALESALMLAEIASHVTVINRNAAFQGEEVLIEKVLSHPKIDVVYNALTTAITGDPIVDGIVYTDEAGASQSLSAQGVFVHIGVIPNSGIVPPTVKKNTFGEIEIDARCQTSVPGLFAAGDVTATPYKQAVIAAGQGVTAALAAVDYLNKL